ncbi:MAG: glycosyltransferase family 39 protein [Candidatus Hodarchaeota archaeon]
MKFIKKIDFYDKLSIILFTIYLFLLIVLSHFHEMGGYGVETDFYGRYAIQAKRILEGKIYEDMMHGPGYPVVLALLSVIFGNMFTTGKIISIISALLFGFLIFKVFRVLFNSKLAFYTLLVLFINIIPFPVLVSIDMFFAFLVGLTIFFIFKEQKITNVRLFFSGLVAGYAFITRYDGVSLAASVVFSIFFINPEYVNWAQRMKNVAIFTFAFFLSSLPWLVINFMQSGSPLHNLTYLNMAANFYGIQGASYGEFIRTASEKFDSFFAVFSYDPPRFILGVIKNTYYHFNSILFDVLRFPLFLFFVPGAVILMNKINKRQLSCFVFPVFGFCVLSLAIFLKRYYLPFIPFFVILSLYFVFYYRDNFEKENSFLKKVFSFSKISFIFIAVFVLNSGIKEAKRYINTEPTELLKLSQTLREQTTEKDIIIARKPHLGYLSNMKTIYFPEVNSLEELLTYAEKEGATYLLYSTLEAELRPKLRILHEPKKVSASLKVVYQQDEPKIFLYQIL